MSAGAVLGSSRCDSSDCLLCHGGAAAANAGAATHECAQTARLQRQQCLAAPAPSSSPLAQQSYSLDGGSSSSSTTKSGRRSCGCSSSSDSDVDDEDADELRRRRRRRRDAKRARGAAAAAAFVGGGDDGARATAAPAPLWSWRPEFAARDAPAPARLAVAAALLPPGAGSSGGGSACRGDMVCALGWSADGRLLAAGGVAKHIAVYGVPQQLDADAAWEAAAAASAVRSSSSGSTTTTSSRWNDAAAAAGAVGGGAAAAAAAPTRWRQAAGGLPPLAPLAVLRHPAKVGSLSWCPHRDGVIAVGDYDGTLTLVHAATGHQLAEVDAHAGRRIWSVAHATRRRHLAATASDDRTARLWAGPSLETCAATVTLPGRPAVCCVDFGGDDERLLALAASDHCVHLFDLRRLDAPLAVLRGHARPVAYARFMGPHQLVSASTDGSLALWRLDGAAAAPAASSSSSLEQQLQRPAVARAGPAAPLGGSGSSSLLSNGNGSNGIGGGGAPLLLRPAKAFRGHRNEKNFVGLSVAPRAGLIAVGSESGAAFAYHTSWGAPLASHAMCGGIRGSGAVAAAAAEPWSAGRQAGSVCAVAWRPEPPAGAAGAGAATLLAAATSQGECRLLSLLEP